MEGGSAQKFDLYQYCNVKNNNRLIQLMMQRLTITFRKSIESKNIQLFRYCNCICHFYLKLGKSPSLVIRVYREIRSLSASGLPPQGECTIRISINIVLPGSAKESQLRCLRSDYLVMISCKYFYISSQPFSESIRLRGMRFRGCFFIHYILIYNAEKLFLSLQINFHKNVAI